MEELINALTHGIGIIFSIVGTCMMMSRAAMRHDATAIIACAVFCVSIITLYTGSTLYHSFVFVLRRVSFIFGVLDHSFIYILIAGTYTPFMLIPLRDVRGSSYVLIAEWALLDLASTCASMRQDCGRPGLRRSSRTLSLHCTQQCTLTGQTAYLGL